MKPLNFKLATDFELFVTFLPKNKLHCYFLNNRKILAWWIPAFTPGSGQTSRVYSNNPVLLLYISCYVTVNKPVLSYLSLCLLPQW
jgi:hypothetical protein